MSIAASRTWSKWSSTSSTRESRSSRDERVETVALLAHAEREQDRGRDQVRVRHGLERDEVHAAGVVGRRRAGQVARQPRLSAATRAGEGEQAPVGQHRPERVEARGPVQAEHEPLALRVAIDQGLEPGVRPLLAPHRAAPRWIRSSRAAPPHQRANGSRNPASGGPRHSASASRSSRAAVPRAQPGRPGERAPRSAADRARRRGRAAGSRPNASRARPRAGSRGGARRLLHRLARQILGDPVRAERLVGVEQEQRHQRLRLAGQRKRSGASVDFERAQHSIFHASTVK